MKPFYQILKFAYSYRFLALLNALFNILSVLFSLCSITLIIPILGILFGTQQKTTTAPEFEKSIDWLKDYLSFRLSMIIETVGEIQALGIICLSIVMMTFLKSLTRYLALYTLVPIRTGIVKDIRQALHEKMSLLSISYFSEQRKGDLISRPSKHYCLHCAYARDERQTHLHCFIPFPDCRNYYWKNWKKSKTQIYTNTNSNGKNSFVH